MLSTGTLPVLAGSWYLLTNYNWAYNPTYNWDNPYKALWGYYKLGYKYSYNWLVSTMNLQVPAPIRPFGGIISWVISTVIIG